MPWGTISSGELGEHPVQLDRLGVLHRPACVELGEVEKLFDEAAEPLCLLVPDLDERLSRLRVEPASLGERREDAVHRARGRSQLVGGDRDEVRLQLVEMREPVVQPRPVDRDGHPVRDELQQLDVVARETPVRQRADVEDADHLVADQQRHAEHRLDAFLAQDRVQDVGVVDVVEDHRAALAADAAREAAAHGDPHALLDLLLDPDRGARHQLVRLLVQQEDAQVSAARMSRILGSSTVEQLAHLEVLKRGVGDRLDVLDPRRAPRAPRRTAAHARYREPPGPPRAGATPRPRP